MCIKAVRRTLMKLLPGFLDEVDDELRLSVPRMSIFPTILFLERSGDETDDRVPCDDVRDADIFDDVTDWADKLDEVEEMLELTVLLLWLLLRCLSTWLLLLLLQGDVMSR